MTMSSRTPWREKLNRDCESRLKEDPRGRGMMLIPCGPDVDALVRKVRQGELVTVNQLRDHLAADHGADLTCPLVTGIMLRIAAEVAEEDLGEGRKRVTPYWRVLKSDGGLNPKFPGGVKRQAARLEEEGFEIEPARGKQPPKVKGYQVRLKRGF